MSLAEGSPAGLGLGMSPGLVASGLTLGNSSASSKGGLDLKEGTNHTIVEESTESYGNTLLKPILQKKNQMTKQDKNIIRKQLNLNCDSHILNDDLNIVSHNPGGN